MMLQMLRPVTPRIPNRPEKMKPPTSAPSMPSTRSRISPEPVLLRILLAMKPAISPRMIQLITPMLPPPCLEPARPTRLNEARSELAEHLLNDEENATGRGAARRKRAAAVMLDARSTEATMEEPDLRPKRRDRP